MTRVETSNEGHVRIISLNGPASRNAVSPGTARALYQAFTAFAADPSARVAVLYGKGGHFCSGFDLKALADGEADRWLDELHFGTDQTPPLGPMGPTRMTPGKPVIAAVAGCAVAGGMELALWCDLRVMEASAYMGVFCRRWGVPLIDGGTVRLPRLVGQGRALELILTGRRIDSRECMDIGLCEHRVEDGASLDFAVGLARSLSRLPQACLRADLDSVRRGSGSDDPSALEAEFRRGIHVLSEARQGATRFAAGAGRHGAAED